MGIEGVSLTSSLNAKVDLTLRWMGDGVATKLHISTVGKQESEININVYIKKVELRLLWLYFFPGQSIWPGMNENRNTGKQDSESNVIKALS